MAGNLTFFRPNIMGVRTINPFTDDERVLPVFYNYPYTENDSLSIELPATYNVDALPEPVALDTDFGSYRVTCTVQDDLLIYQRHLSINQREIPAASYEDLKSFFQAVVRTDKAQVVLKRKPLTTQE